MKKNVADVINSEVWVHENDKEFCGRVWSTSQSVYESRLRAIGFAGLERVLDAGCGFGQWTQALANLNQEVIGVDGDENRVNIAKKIVLTAEIEIADLEMLNFPDAHFNAIFSYSVLYFTNHHRVIKEFSRVLKDDGVLYICGNGLGWYLHNLLDENVSRRGFDRKAMAIEAIENSLQYYQTGVRKPGQQLIISLKALSSLLEENSFYVIDTGGEGTINKGKEKFIKSFFNEKYYDNEGVYEILAKKRNEIGS